MFIPELSAEDVAGYCRLDTPLDDRDRQVLKDILMPAALAHMERYTGQSAETLCEHEELTVVYLALCSFLYDNRSFGTVTDAKQNEVGAGFLDGYCLILIGLGV